MHRQLTLRARLFGWALAAVVLTTASLALLVLALTGAALVTVWIGVPMLAGTIASTRVLADQRRRHARAMLGRDIESPYLRIAPGGPLARLRALAADPAVRRDLLWLLADATVGLALSIVAVVEGVLDLIFWWLPPGLAARTHAALDCTLLSVSEKSRLALRVQELTEARTETVDAQAGELRRIERDLHDGAQARLVALGMSLALAEEQLASNPDGARALLAEARGSGTAALAELRDLVRGIHPPVLADRGLVGAVQALALSAAVPVEVRADVAGRLPDPVESAAYFAVAEALANALKHASAAHVWIELEHVAGTLRVRVRDDGVGGADLSRGSGLRGIARRLAAFDATLHVSSPPGGPTELAMVLPCALSSPKTSPSSGTA